MNIDDMMRRWREAKLGHDGSVRVECEGDPRAEVLALVEALRDAMNVTVPHLHDWSHGGPCECGEPQPPEGIAQVMSSSLARRSRPRRGAK